MPNLMKMLTLEALSEALPSWLKRSTKPEYNADEIDSTLTTNQFVSASDKENWNAKGTYSKPSGGIPKSDLASAVQTSLGKADTALQSFTETDPTVPSWAKASSKPSYTQDEVGDGSTYKRVTSTEKSTWNNKGTYSKPSGGIPKSDLASAVQTSLGKADTALQSFTETDPTVPSWAKQSSKPSYTASEVGAIATSAKGAANGVASLDSAGKVPSSQLPSYVDDVLEYSAKSSFPSTGETGKIYVDTSTNKTYRWSGSAYVEISASLALGETSSTAYYGDKGKTAYTHATETRLTTATASGLYKVASTVQGHIASLTSVAKADITALGIPAQDTTYGVVSTSANGLAPKVTDTSKFLKGDGTWATPANTWTAMVGATSSANGSVGYVNATPPKDGYNTKYLRADGSWQVPPNTTYSDATTSASGLMSATDKSKLNGIATGATAVSESTVSGWGFTKNTGTYSKPSTGIPKSDLASAVQTSLGKADSALQSFTETDPTVPSWAKQSSKPSYTQDEISDGSTYKRVTSTEKNTWNNKGTYSKPSGGIPKTDLASAVQTSLGLADTSLQHTTLTGSPDLDTYLTTGVYHIATSTATHAPTTNHATLFVDATVGTPYQIFKPDNVDSPWYTRHRSGSAWTSWVAMKFTDTTYSAATTSAAGLMSAADKTKLDGIATGATANIGTVTQVKVGSSAYNPSSGVVSLPAYPTTLPASDVYSWAKQSSKPSYSASEISGLGSAATYSATSSVTSGSSSLITSGAVYSGLANVSKNIARVERNFTSTADVLSSTGCKYTTQSNKVYRITAWAEYSSTNPLAVAIVNSTNGAVFGYAEHPSTLTNVRVTATALIIGAEAVEIKAKYAGSATCAVGMIVEEISGV